MVGRQCAGHASTMKRVPNRTMKRVPNRTVDAYIYVGAAHIARTMSRTEGVLRCGRNPSAVRARLGRGSGWSWFVRAVACRAQRGMLIWASKFYRIQCQWRCRQSVFQVRAVA
jgi:hypothetical protein